MTLQPVDELVWVEGGKEARQMQIVVDLIKSIFDVFSEALLSPQDSLRQVQTVALLLAVLVLELKKFC